MKYQILKVGSKCRTSIITFSNQFLTVQDFFKVDCADAYLRNVSSVFKSISLIPHFPTLDNRMLHLTVKNLFSGRDVELYLSRVNWRENISERVGWEMEIRERWYFPHCNTDRGGQILGTWCRIRWHRSPGSCICPGAPLAARCSRDASARNPRTSLWHRTSAATLPPPGPDPQPWSSRSPPWVRSNTDVQFPDATRSVQAKSGREESKWWRTALQADNHDHSQRTSQLFGFFLFRVMLNTWTKLPCYAKLTLLFLLQ